MIRGARCADTSILVLNRLNRMAFTSRQLVCAERGVAATGIATAAIVTQRNGTTREARFTGLTSSSTRRRGLPETTTDAGFRPGLIGRGCYGDGEPTPTV